MNIDKTRVGGSQKKGLVGGKYRPKEVDKKGKKKSESEWWKRGFVHISSRKSLTGFHFFHVSIKSKTQRKRKIRKKKPPPRTVRRVPREGKKRKKTKKKKLWWVAKSTNLTARLFSLSLSLSLSIYLMLCWFFSLLDWWGLLMTGDRVGQ